MVYDPKNFQYRSGLSSVGAYQVSGVPYISGSGMVIPANTGTPWQVKFPYVTQWITIENTSVDADLRFAFSANGIVSASVVHGTDEVNYWVLPSTGSGGGTERTARSRIRLDVRVKDLYLLSDHPETTATAQIAAGLTMVNTGSLEGVSKTVDEHTSNFPNWSGSVGVG
tara:strand:+ start:221 stop:727 length:507 start_codon:yes stop_codon:yes gene_type:complete